MTYEIKYRREDEMKDSGIEWIGSIPKDWRLTKLKFVIDEFITGGTPNSSNEKYYTEFEKGTPWISISDMSTTNIINRTKSSLTRMGLKSKNLKILKKGTLIYSIFATLGKVAEINIDATTNQAILGLDNNELLANKEYLKYWLINLERYLKYYSSSNTQENLNTSKVRSFSFLDLKKIENQKKIANFLDLKTVEFDSIISKKELLIKKLEQAKKSLISEIVTGKVKILDGELVEREANEMKDSGVEWLGMIPKDWEVSKVGMYYDIKLGKMLQPNQKSKTDTLEKYLCTINIDWHGVKLDNIKKMWFSEREKKEYLVQKGDLIVNEGGDAGKAAIVKEIEDKVYIQNAVHRVRGKYKNKVEYLYYWIYMLKGINYIELICNKATIMHLTLDKFNNLVFLVPDYNEQMYCLNYLNSKTERIDSIIIKTKLQIQKLKEAKQSLISEAVTGKIDLRDWVIEEI